VSDKTWETRILADASPAQAPVTIASLLADLTDLGVRSGMLVNVHCAMSSLGWVAGGAQAVNAALLKQIGPTGTLAMPAHSSQLSEPATWVAPPVPESWWEILRQEMPAYDPARTPTRKMGAVAESFRTYPGVMRSSHPQVSHAAMGPLAEKIVAEHSLDCLFGDQSPIGKLYEFDGFVLLLGVNHGNNTALHLAEDRADFAGKTHHDEGAPMVIDGSRRWQTFRPLKVIDDDFAELGEAFAASGGEAQGCIGRAKARLMKVRELVDFAVPWIENNRKTST
jgi:aminoglycoside 3-N-acetyltransferase